MLYLTGHCYVRSMFVKHHFFKKKIVVVAVVVCLLLLLLFFYYYYWTHGFSRKGPINSASSVRSFVRNADISGSALQNFLIFCTKLEQHNCRKVTFSDFRKKLLAPCGRGQKVIFGPKLDFFKDCFRTARQNFSIFCMKLGNNKAFQTMYMLSSGKLLPRPSRGQKVKFLAQNWIFLKYLLNRVTHFFDFSHEVIH